MNSSHKFNDLNDLLSYVSFDVPIYKNVPANSKFLNYLNKNIQSGRQFLLTEDIEELEWNNLELIPKPEKGISSGVFVMHQKKNLFGLDKNFNTVIAENEEIEYLKRRIEEFFKSRKVILPSNNSISAKYSNFEEFTSIKEEQHISLWACVALSFLSNKTSRIGKEIELPEAANPRDGRLDVCIIDDKKLLMCEAKVSIVEALRDGRFRTRIPSYERESRRIIEQNGLGIESKVIVLVGGSEDPIYGPTHPDHMQDQYIHGKNFIDKCLGSNIQFVTANFLWCSVMRKIVKNDTARWDEVIWDLLDKEEVLGLCSAGIVLIDGNIKAIELQ